MISCLCAARGRLLRGDRVSTLLPRSMPGGSAVPTFNRYPIAAVLTAQWAIGLILMLSAFALLDWLASLQPRPRPFG
jgi:hypothetical protein